MKINMEINMIKDEYNVEEPKIIPSRLKMARISRGFSLADLENLIGVSKQFLSQCELELLTLVELLFVK